MDGNIKDLTSLARKFQKQVDSLQIQLDEARKNLTIVSQAVALLQREGDDDQERLFNLPDVVSFKYKDTTLSAAIKDILLQRHPEKLSAEEIYEELIKNGFKSNSKNMKRDLYTRLFRMTNAKDEPLISIKKGKVKKYSLPKRAESLEPGSKETNNHPPLQA